MRRLLAIACLSVAASIVTPLPAQAQDGLLVCSNQGWIENKTVIAQGCSRGRGRTADGTGTDSTIVCRYRVVIQNDATSELAVYRTRRSTATHRTNYDSGSAADSAAPEITITGITVDAGERAGSSVRFETLKVTGADRQLSGNGKWYSETCYDNSVDPTLAVTITSPVPGGRPVPIAGIVDKALTDLVITAPEKFEHSGPASVLNLATFVSLGDGYFTNPPLTSSASFGTVTVTVEAKPTEYYLTTPEGRVNCDDRNKAWVRGVSEDDPETCTVMFEEPAPDGKTVPVDLTVIFETGWRSNVNGLTDLQPLDNVPATTPGIPHELIEVVGLGTSR